MFTPRPCSSFVDDARNESVREYTDGAGETEPTLIASRWSNSKSPSSVKWELELESVKEVYDESESRLAELNSKRGGEWRGGEKVVRRGLDEDEGEEG